MSSHIPVLIGVADIKQSSLLSQDALEPAELMHLAIKSALSDTGLPSTSLPSLQASIDAISVVRTWSWPYANLPGFLAGKIGVELREGRGVYSEHGGNSPVKLLDEMARLVAQEEVDVGVVVGGEALGSLTSMARKGEFPTNWTPPSDDLRKTFALDLQKFDHNTATRHGIGLPIHVYPLYENAFRASRGQSIAKNHHESARLYAEFAKIAAGNEYSWNYGKPPIEENVIGRPGKGNRMICFPYPLLMNAFNNVNLAAAAILTSTKFAQRLGIPEDKWIYPLGGAGTKDSEHFFLRPNYTSSPSLSRSLDAALSITNLTIKDIDLIDIYSCFPIVPKLAAHHLGIPLHDLTRPLTLLGGLTSFGGAGNNYSLHAITAAVRQLRSSFSSSAGPSLHGKQIINNNKDNDNKPHQKERKHALILANGGVLTYQHVLILSQHPRGDGSSYPTQNPLPESLADECPAPEVVEQVSAPTTSTTSDIASASTTRKGKEAVVETYTVSYSRAGRAEVGVVVGRSIAGGSNGGSNGGGGGGGGDDKGERFVANAADRETVGELASWEIEPVGRRGLVWFDGEKGRNLFVFLEKNGGCVAREKERL